MRSGESGNLLLGMLPWQDQERILRDCEQVELHQRQILIEAEERIQHIYFPTSGVVSHLVVLNDGSSIESGMTGNDGFIGLSGHLGAELSPLRFIVQVPGSALRLPATRLRHHAYETPRLQTLLARYSDYMLAVAAQSAACNRLHSVTQRCARWLLRIQDHIKDNEFPLTQETLAQLLGVRRASVSLAAGLLQDAGLISYAYGRVTIIDQQGLEKHACECVGAIRRRHESLFASLLG
jgi:CRP-like cAMP-binding protein